MMSQLDSLAGLAPSLWHWHPRGKAHDLWRGREVVLRSVVAPPVERERLARALNLPHALLAVSLGMECPICGVAPCLPATESCPRCFELRTLLTASRLDVAEEPPVPCGVCARLGAEHVSPKDGVTPMCVACWDEVIT